MSIKYLLLPHQKNNNCLQSKKQWRIRSTATMSRTWKGPDLQTFEKLTKYPVRASTGVKYPCTQRDIDAYEDFGPVLRCIWNGIKGGHISDVNAVQRLSEFLEPKTLLPNYIATAFSRCKDATRGSSWGPETISKALFDLNTTLFNGHLRGLIMIRWVTPGSTDGRMVRRDKDCCKSLGMTYYAGNRRSIIYLNVIAIFRAPDPEKEMWQTMIHELLVSGSSKED